MMEPLHKIDDLVLDLSFSTKQCARQEQAAIQTWVTETLLAEVEQLFSQYSPSTQVLRFDQLVIDIGRVSVLNYKTAITQKLLKELSCLIDGRLSSFDIPVVQPFLDANSVAGIYFGARTNWGNSIHSGDSAKSGNSTNVGASTNRGNSTHDADKVQQQNLQARERSSAQLQELIEFLLTGNFTKHRSDLLRSRHAQLISQVINDLPIADVLRALPNPVSVIRRMISQFSQTDLVAIVRQLNPSQLPLILDFIDLLEGAELQSSNSALSKQILSNRIWEEVIGYFIGYSSENSNENSNSVSWIKSIIVRLSQSVMVPTDQIIQAIVNSNSLMALNINMRSPVLKILLSTFGWPSSAAKVEFQRASAVHELGHPISSLKHSAQIDSNLMQGDSLFSNKSLLRAGAIFEDTSPLRDGTISEKTSLLPHSLLGQNALLRDKSLLGESSLAGEISLFRDSGAEFEFSNQNYFDKGNAESPYAGNAHSNLEAVGNTNADAAVNATANSNANTNTDVNADAKTKSNANSHTPADTNIRLNSHGTDWADGTVTLRSQLMSLEFSLARFDLESLSEQQVEYSLAHALINPDSAFIASHWMAIRLKFPDLSRKIIKNYFSQSDSRTKIIRGLPKAFLMDMAFTLEPRLGQSLRRYIDSHAQLFLYVTEPTLKSTNTAFTEQLFDSQELSERQASFKRESYSTSISPIADVELWNRIFLRLTQSRSSSFDNQKFWLSIAHEFATDRTASIVSKSLKDDGAGHHRGHDLNQDRNPISVVSTVGQIDGALPAFEVNHAVADSDTWVTDDFRNQNSPFSGIGEIDRVGGYDNIHSLNIEQIRSLLADIFSTMDFQFLGEIWTYLEANFPALLVDSLWHFTRRAEIRQAFITQLPEAYWLSAVNLLAPNLTQVANALFENSAILYQELMFAQEGVGADRYEYYGQPQSQPNAPSLEGTDSIKGTDSFKDTDLNEWKIDIWQNAFAVIIQHSDVQSSPAIFLSHVLTKLASLYHLDTRQAIKVWFELFEQQLPPVFGASFKSDSLFESDYSSKSDYSFESDYALRGRQGMGAGGNAIDSDALNSDTALNSPNSSFDQLKSPISNSSNPAENYSAENKLLIELDSYLLRYDRDVRSLNDLLASLANHPVSLANFYAQIETHLTYLPSLALSHSDWLALIRYYWIARKPKLRLEDFDRRSVSSHLRHQSTDILYSIFVSLFTLNDDELESTLFDVGLRDELSNFLPNSQSRISEKDRLLENRINSGSGEETQSRENTENSVKGETVVSRSSANSLVVNETTIANDAEIYMDSALNAMSAPQLTQLVVDKAIPLNRLAALAVDLKTLVDEYVYWYAQYPQSLRSDLVESIHVQAEQVIDKNNYYIVVLDQLIHNRVLDLEAIANRIGEPAFSETNFSEGNSSESYFSEPVNISKKNLSNTSSATPNSYFAEEYSTSRSTIDKNDGNDIDSHSMSSLELLSHKLRRKEKTIADIRLSDAEWWALIKYYLDSETSMIAAFKEEVLSAIQAAAAQLPQKHEFYRGVVTALVNGDVIDIEAFVSNSTQIGARDHKQSEQSYQGIDNQFVPLNRIELSNINESQLREVVRKVHLRQIDPDKIDGDLSSWQKFYSVYLYQSNASLGQQNYSPKNFDDSHSIDEVLNALAHYAQVSANHNRFYQTILYKLQWNQVLDFEAVAYSREEFKVVSPIAGITTQSQRDLLAAQEIKSATLSKMDQAFATITDAAILDSNASASHLPTNSARKAVNNTSRTPIEREAGRPIVNSVLLDNLDASQLNSVVYQLRDNEIKPHQLDGKPASWQLLLDAYLTTNNSLGNSQAPVDSKGLRDSHISGDNNVLVNSHTDFVNSIGIYAEQASNKNRFYQSVLSELINDRLIDLELLAINEASLEQQSVFVDYEEKTNLLNEDSGMIELDNHSDLTAPEFTSINHPQRQGPSHKYSMIELLGSSGNLSSEQLLHLQEMVNGVIHQGRLGAFDWSTIFTDADLTAKFVNLVPGHILHSLMTQLQPQAYSAVDRWVRLVMASLALLVANSNLRNVQNAAWRCVLALLFSKNSLTDDYVRKSLVENMGRAAGVDDIQRLNNLVQRRHALLNSDRAPKAQFSQDQIADKIRAAMESDALQVGLSLNNVGMVLIAPYLPRLFSMLGLVKDGEFLHLGAADRAVHLLQFIVTGEGQTPEYELFLNKLLCGISTSIPVSAGIEVTQNERDTIEQMLKSIIQHWSVLGSTSIAGLRETFLQRQGWLRFEEDGWYLDVKEGTFDMLIDYIPWGYSIVKYAWMDKPVHVKWRNKN